MTTQSNFDELLKSLNDAVAESDTLAKAAPPAAPADGEVDDDAAVAAAAADSGVAVPAGDDAPAPNDDDEPVDATQLIKSMLEKQVSTDEVLAKALTSMSAALTKQNDLIKSLQAEVHSLRGQGAGRKSLLNVAERPAVGDLAKSQAADAGKVAPAELLAKSMAAFQAGKISGAEANTVDVCLRNGFPIDAGLIQRIAQA